MGGVEVAVGQVITHARDLVPRHAGLGVEQFSGQGFDGLTDLEQPDPDGVEYQPVGEGAALLVRADASMAAWMSASRCRSR